MKTLFSKEENQDWIPVVHKEISAKAAKKSSMTPLLIIVFVASYCLMTLLIVEQGGTIQSQRNLIQMLQADSTQFWAIKSKALHEKQMAQY
ncbi:MAG: hypothetical protein WAL56_11705, partial [Candidatus Sulfotelmatobacter sp.]